MEINEVEKSIERYMKIYNQIQSNIDAKQLALNDQSSKNLFANGKLTIDQMNETIQEITNIGFFVCVSNESDLSKYREIILSSLGASPTSIDDLIQQIGNSSIVMTILVEYELAGKISRVSGNKVILNF